MTYRAPINDMLLALNHGAGLQAAVKAGHYGDFDGDIAAAVLEEAGKIASDVLAPLNHTGDLMTKRERQAPARSDIEPFVAAEREIAVLHVQIGMAHATSLDAHQNFATARDGALDDGLAERFPISHQ